MTQDSSIRPDHATSYVDMDGALRRLGGSEKIYATLLQSFLGDGTFEKLRQDVAKGDLEAAAVSAHTMKGVAGNLSLTALYEASIQLESRIKQGKFDAETFAAFSQIWQSTIACVKQTIDALA